MMRWIAALAFAVLPHAVSADMGAGHDVVFLGERHDNPHHHQTQAEWARSLAPAALVFEMLTPDQAAAVTPETRADQESLEAALGWADSGWPAFSMYYPIFAAAPDARIFGAAVPRDAARAAMTEGVAKAFGDEADIFGLTDPLSEDQQSQREAMQLAAHCDALPGEMLPLMVDVQRLRDASLARAAKLALEETGGPVVVITGNGHARMDWGAPAALALAAPEISLFSLGQSEDGVLPHGTFSEILDAPPVDRDDPCEAFRNRSGN